MITVKLFGLLRLDTSVKELTLDAATVGDIPSLLAAEVKKRNPDLKVTAKDMEGCIVQVNGKTAKKSAPLHDGDTVMLFSPVCGG